MTLSLILSPTHEGVLSLPRKEERTFLMFKRWQALYSQFPDPSQKTMFGTIYQLLIRPPTYDRQPRGLSRSLDTTKSCVWWGIVTTPRSQDKCAVGGQERGEWVT